MLHVNPPSGQELREERERRDLTQVEAALEVGVSLRTWQVWESDGEVIPQPRHRRRLREWLTAEEVAA